MSAINTVNFSPGFCLHFNFIYKLIDVLRISLIFQLIVSAFYGLMLTSIFYICYSYV